MINDRWSNLKSQEIAKYWDKALLQLSDQEYNKLISFCLEALDIKPRKEKIPDIAKEIKNDNDFVISSDIIDIDQHFNRKILYNILDCIVLSEFHLDSVLMLPPDMRKKRMEEISKSMNIDNSLIIQVDKKWRELGDF